MNVKDKIAEAIAEARPYGKRDEILAEIERIAKEAEVRTGNPRAVERQLQAWLDQHSVSGQIRPLAKAAISEIEQLLQNPQGAPARTWYHLGRVANWVLEHYIALAGLIAVAATLFYGLAYTQIYDAVNITPEEAGFTPTQILTHAAVGGVALLLLIAAAVFLPFVPVIAVRDDAGAASEPGSWLRFLGNVALTCASIGTIFILTALLGAPLGLAVTLTGLELLFFLGVSFRSGKERSFPEPRPLRFALSKYLILFAAIGLPVALFLTILITFTEAKLMGERIQAGEAVRGSKVAGLPFLGVRAEPALISWKTNRPVLENLPRCALYLGSSDGDSILYDARRDSTFHVPTADIAMELRAQMGSCLGPVNLRPPSIRTEGNMLRCQRGAWESYLSPDFSVQWFTRGLPALAHEGKRFGPRADLATLSLWKVTPVHCRVTASSDFGEEAAVSETVLVDENGRLLRSGIRAPAHGR